MIAACGHLGSEEEAPPATCAGAYAGLVGDLGATAAKSGTAATFPPAAEFVTRCEALSLSPEQLACLQPARAIADPSGCRAVLAPVRGPVDQLADWFQASTTLPIRAPGSPLQSGAQP
jgi:hypothetical protein